MFCLQKYFANMLIQSVTYVFMFCNGDILKQMILILMKYNFPFFP